MINPMRDSGVEWIGDITEGWAVTKIKYTTQLNGRIGWQGLTSSEYQEQGPYLITGTDFENGQINFEKAVHIEEQRWKEATQIQVENNDLLITKDGTVGKVAIISGLNEKASLNSGVLRIQTTERVCRKFLYYVLLSEEFWLWFNYTNSGASTILHLYQNVFERFTYVIPSIQEQQAIANFLDEETKKLDDAKDLLEQQIEKLKEYRKSLIWETVTKGLDKTVPMKDSGVDWIGEIPVSWEVKPIKYIYEIIGSGTTPRSDHPELYDGTVNWIQSGDLYQVDEVNETTKTITELGKRSSTALKIYESPFIAVAMYGASVGNLAISRVDATVNQAVAILKDFDSKVYFGKYALEASKQELINAAVGGTQPNISQILLRGWILPQPNVEIQEKISNFLDEKTSIIEKTISNIQSQIEVINKLRKTLIYDYVTGKRRVI